MLTSAKKPFCATAVINGSTERAAVVYPETCIETLSSLGKTFLGDANHVPLCAIVCLRTTVVALSSFRPPFHQNNNNDSKKKSNGVQRGDQTVESPFLELPDNSNQKSFPSSVKSCNISEFKVHLTPKIFFAKIIRLILWSNLAQTFFDLVKSSNFYAPPKPSFRWFATAQGESGES